jgi:hypothetical protein
MEAQIPMLEAAGRWAAIEVTRVIQVKVSGLAKDSVTGSPVVLLEGIDRKGVLPIWIGHSEAQAIAYNLTGQTFERPLTHDLLRIVIEGFDARVQKVIITELRGNTFYAKIHVTRNEEILVIDARPSDSIALALRAQAPIYVGVELFENNSREMALHDEEEEEPETRLGPLPEDDDPDR